MPQTMSQPCGANYALPAVRIPPISVFEHTMWVLNDAAAGWPGTVREGRSHTRDTCLTALNPFAAKSFNCCACGSASDFATDVLCAWQCTMASGARDFGRDCHDMLERLLTVSKLCVGRTLLSTNSTQHGLVCANHGTRHALFLL